MSFNISIERGKAFERDHGMCATMHSGFAETSLEEWSQAWNNRTSQKRTIQEKCSSVAQIPFTMCPGGVHPLTTFGIPCFHAQPQQQQQQKCMPNAPTASIGLVSSFTECGAGTRYDWAFPLFGNCDNRSIATTFPRRVSGLPCANSFQPFAFSICTRTIHSD
jgi:hypothetical protein